MIYVGVVFLDSVFYNMLAAYSVAAKNHDNGYLLTPSHAMSVVLRQEGVLIPNAWLGFPYHKKRASTITKLTVLPYTPPSNFSADKLTLT